MLPKAPLQPPVPPLFPTPVRDSSEPMQLGLSRPSLTLEERQRRRMHNLCMYCGESGHMVRACPAKAGKWTSTESPVCLITPATHLLLSLSLQLVSGVTTVNAVLDSGACGCFVDLTFATAQKIPLHVKDHSMVIKLADGTNIKSGLVTHETAPLLVSTTSGHQEHLVLDAIASPLFPIILGFPWLKAHNPHVDWVTGHVGFTSNYCSQHCFPAPPKVAPVLLNLETSFDPETLRMVPAVYHSFLDVFSKKGADVLPPHRAYDCPIELLPGAAIPFGRIYPLSETEQVALKDYIEENLKKGFIRPSTSPAGAGIFFVEKKDRTLRPCIDFRELNKVTVKNRYPLPLVPELFQRLGSARIFTKLDLRGAYNLVRIREGDEWKTAFRTRFGHYEYLVMPFGLCNAPATFQHFVNEIFKDFIDQFLIVYLDDILIFSSSLSEHRTHVAQVLHRLRQFQLYAKAEKCEFEKSEIAFLGLIVSVSGVTMDPQKVSAVLEWPAPDDRKGVQRFVGFANFYRKFIRNFSAIIAPITQLTKSNIRFHWTQEAQKAFDALKRQFTSAPILRHPDTSLPFVLEVDASEVAVGAILSQRQGIQAALHPVAFFSRKLTPPERNYDVGDRELLAIKTALEEWRYLLEGAKHPILVFTDHRNLEYLQAAKRLRPRQARWALFFARFQFHVTFRPGSKNVKPDALSRMHCKPGDENSSDTILAPQNFLLLQGDLITSIRQTLEGITEPPVPGLIRKDGLFWLGNQLFVPEVQRTAVLQACHDSPLAGHFGSLKTTHLLLRSFWWPQAIKDCAQYVASCPTCAQNKDSRTKAWGLLEPLPVPERPWSMISMDFVVELPPSQEFTSIFVVVDRFSKMAHFIPMKGTPTATQTAETFIREILRLHGLPNNIVSDRGTQFTSNFWRALCKSLSIQLNMSSAYHPQSNGQTERTNQTLEQYLRCFSSFNQDNWSSLLPQAEFAYNNALHSATKESPFYTNYGFHPKFLPDLPPEGPVPAVQKTVEQLQASFQSLRNILAQANERYKQQFDRRRRGDLELQPGDQVWLATKNLRLACPSKKLGPRFIGPFPILRKINRVAFELDLPASMRIHPVFHVALLKPVTTNSFSTQRPNPPGPILVEGQEEYEVETILDCRKRANGLQFLVKWKGYGPEENSWEPRKNLHAPELLQRFIRTHPAKMARLGIRRLPLGGGQCQRISPLTLQVRRRPGGRTRPP